MIDQSYKVIDLQAATAPLSSFKLLYNQNLSKKFYLTI
jgi:hypothetical protein